MTPNDWIRIVEEVEKRWPGDWQPIQTVAAFEDLKRFDPVDVWAALNHLNEQGLEFAPRGSMLLAATIEQARRSSRDELWRQLPMEVEEGAMFWGEYAEQAYGGRISFEEATRREHRKWDGCRAPKCDIHRR